MRRSMMILCAILLTACGGGTDVNVGAAPETDNAPPPSTPEPAPSDSTAPACDSIAGGGAKVNWNIDAGCLECNVDNGDAAADGDFGSFAAVKVNVDAPAQGVSLRATAQPGVVFPAGHQAGVDLELPDVLGQIGYEVEVRTYLQGVQQESQVVAGGPGNLNICGSCGGSRSFDGFVTSKAFDAVGLFFSNNQGGGAPVFKVYEICSDHQD